jgi:hypothetical protein
VLFPHWSSAILVSLIWSNCPVHCGILKSTLLTIQSDFHKHEVTLYNRQFINFMPQIITLL